MRRTKKLGSQNILSLNFRDVAVQCTISKILDLIITNRHLKNILTHHQHGFVNGKSTVTNLVEYTNIIMDALTTHKLIEAIYFDLFVSVNVDLLIDKLRIISMNQRII